MKYLIKELTQNNISPEFFATLVNLSKTVKEDIPKAKKVWKEIKRNPNHKIFIAINKNNEVVGLTTLLIERKFIHKFGKLGHIEDVVTRKGYEGKGIGSSLVKKATGVAKKTGCYRVKLYCSDANIKFYKRFGYRKKENSMAAEFFA